MKTAAIYARVANSEEPIEHQLLALRVLGTQLGYEVVGYTDISSGTKARRPGLDAMMRDARKRKFSVVIAASADRIARSTKHFLQTVDELGRLDIEFVSAREAIDTSGAMGRLYATLSTSLLALEKSLNAEKIRQGMRRARFEGQRLGRAPLDVNHAALVRDRLNGMSLTACSKKFGCSRASVVKWVRESKRRDIAEVGGFSVGHEEVADVDCVA